MKKILLFTVSLCLTFLNSCDESDTVDKTLPSDLSVVYELSDEIPALLTVTATATNVTEYQFESGKASEEIMSNSTGIFEFSYPQEGIFTTVIRAYNADGRYLKKEKQIVVDFEDDIPVTVGEGYTSALSYEGMSLIWSDEFDGTSLNLNDWTYEIGGSGWGNNELQYYRPDNTSVAGGVLTIEAKKESYEGKNYTSSRLITQDKQSFKYGRIDIRAVMPEGQGIWPALWMLGSNFKSAGWPDCGEIDIMEMVGGDHDNRTHGTIHWDNNGSYASYGGSTTLSEGKLSDEYHVYSIIWDENSINWLLDDTQFHVVDISGGSLNEFQASFFFIFNVAVGGNWPGSPDETTLFPQKMMVDYVRVFQDN